METLILLFILCNSDILEFPFVISSDKRKLYSVTMLSLFEIEAHTAVAQLEVACSSVRLLVLLCMSRCPT